MTGTIAAAQPPFARLVERLRERGFTAPDYTTPGPREFRTPTSPLIVSIDDGRTPPRAVIASYDTGPAWTITLAGDLPDTLLLDTLDAALRAHVGTAAPPTPR